MAVAVTDKFKKALQGGHKIAIRVDVYRDGKLFHSFRNKTTLVVSGEVTIQEDGERMARVTIIDPDGIHIPESFQSDFWYGREMHVYRGIDYQDGTPAEMVRLGVFRIRELRVTGSPQNRAMTIRAMDYSDKVRRAKFSDVYEVAEGQNSATVVRTLLEQAGITKFNFVPVSSTTTKRSYQRGGDRWAAAVEIAEAAGYLLYFDADGIAVMQVIPHPWQVPVSWEYDATRNDSLPVLSTERTGTDERIYNHIVITGEGDKNIVRAVAKDTNVGSPTYILGPFGDVPYFRVVAASTTQADAQRIADQVLIQATRGTERVVFTTIPNPAMEINDIVYLKDPRTKVDGNYVVAYFTIPFERGANMTVTTNLRRSAS